MRPMCSNFNTHCVGLCISCFSFFPVTFISRSCDSQQSRSPSAAKFKNAWIWTASLPYVLMVWSSANSNLHYWAPEMKV